MTNLSHLRRIVLAAAFSLTGAAPAMAADLTIKPGHVFALWQNVNDCLVSTVRSTTMKMVLISEINDMAPAAFENKTPGDLFELTAVVRGKLERLRAKMGAQPWPETLDMAGGSAQQMHAYLAAGMALDSLASLLVAKTGPEQSVYVCYKAEIPDGKSASDVYAMVELASRRLDAVIKALGA
jgi:hypothetical protein